MERRKISRKFVVAIVTALSLLVLDLTGLEIPLEVQAMIVSIIGLWIGGEAITDAADRIGKRGQ